MSDYLHAVVMWNIFLYLDRKSRKYIGINYKINYKYFNLKHIETLID